LGKPSAPTTNYPDELNAAQATLSKSRLIADTIIPKKAQSDLPYWFAELYYYITFYEIQDRSVFSHPAFVMHFIPIFYDMYAGPAQQYAKSGATGTAESAWKAMVAALPGAAAGAVAGWAAGMAVQAAAGAAKAATSRVAIPDHWQDHFTTASQIVDPSQTYPYVKAATNSLISGVKAHIKHDMADALAKAYRTYTDKYSNVPPFHTYYPDFFQRNKPIFGKVRVALINELVNRGLGMAAYGKSVNPEFVSKAADIMNEGLNIDEIYDWRNDAWRSAKSQLRL
jgi:hypothetical protein